MSYDPQSAALPALKALQLSNYVAFGGVTAVIYDYLLIFPEEIDYVWRRPWSWVSTMFILVRYVGLSWVILSFFSSIFTSGSQTMYVFWLRFSAILILFLSCTVTVLVYSWEYIIFLAAADWVMILRVYAMWNQSKKILYVLLFIYVSQIIISAVFLGIYFVPNTHLSVTVSQVVNFYLCNYSFSGIPSMKNIYVLLPRLLLGTALLVLAVAQTIKQSVDMYRATNEWQANRYMQLFTRDGILYFFVNMTIYVIAWVESGGEVNNTLALFFYSFSYVAICTMMPRFIIDVRELYDRELRRRWQGIDTGFGSQPTANQYASTIEFAYGTSGQGQWVDGNVDESEVIWLEERSGGDIVTPA